MGLVQLFLSCNVTTRGDKGKQAAPILQQFKGWWSERYIETEENLMSTIGWLSYVSIKGVTCPTLLYYLIIMATCNIVAQ